MPCNVACVRHSLYEHAAWGAGGKGRGTAALLTEHLLLVLHDSVFQPYNVRRTYYTAW